MNWEGGRVGVWGLGGSGFFILLDIRFDLQ